MGMNVVTVGVSRHHNFEAIELFRQLQCNLMGGLGCQILFWVERLNQMIEHPTIGFVVEAFRI